MFKRLFSKKSGFTLVEIIIAFVVFALFATMIMQILNMVSLQRKSNAQFSDKIDEQELALLTKTKKDFDGSSVDGTLELDFGEYGKVATDYQMYGKFVGDSADGPEVDGLAYFQGDEIVSAMPPVDSDPDDGDDDDDDNNDGGSQMDRVNARITGTRGFEYISINQIVKLGTDADGNTVYALDISASAKGMSNDDVPRAAYRLYFLNSSNKACNIVYANYLNDQTGDLASVAGNTGAKMPIDSSTGVLKENPDNANKYTVSIVSSNGIRIGSPFKSAPQNNSGNSSKRARCTNCNRIMYQNSWGGWVYEDNNEAVGSLCTNPDNPWYDPCTNHMQLIYEEPDENAPYTGSGEKFYDTTGYHTRIEIAFSTDPGLTTSSFGQNGVMQADGSCKYEPNATVGGVKVGPNIYGAYPK